MKKVFIFIIFFCFFGGSLLFPRTKISKETKMCISCHLHVTPQLVKYWKISKHAKVTVVEAIKKGKLNRKIITVKILNKILNFVVGCAECHTLNIETHNDIIEHNGYKIHIIVPQKDCALCHPNESS